MRRREPGSGCQTSSLGPESTVGWVGAGGLVRHCALYAGVEKRGVESLNSLIRGRGPPLIWGDEGQAIGWWLVAGGSRWVFFKPPTSLVGGWTRLAKVAF